MFGDRSERTGPRGIDEIRAGLALAVAAAIGVALAVVFFATYQTRFDVLAAATESVVERRPYSIAFQSRLLAPSLFALGTRLTGSSGAAVFVSWMTALSVAVVLTTTIAFARYRRSWRDGLGYGLFEAVALVLLRDASWLHLWDLVDVLVATAFAYAVFTEARLGVLGAIFGVGIFNRESALFIPMWVALSALPTQRDARLRLPRLAAGVAGLASGLAFIWVIRERLFHGEKAPRGRPLAPWGNHLTVEHNVHDWLDAIRTMNVRSLAVYAALVAVAVLVFRARRRLPAPVARVPALLGLMTAATLVFSLILETRTWFFFTPLVAFVHASASRAGAAPLAPRATESPGGGN